MGIIDKWRKDSPVQGTPADTSRSLASSIERLDGNRFLRFLLFLLVAFSVLSLIAQPVVGKPFSPVSLKAAVFGLFILATAMFHLFLGQHQLVFVRNRRIVVVFGLILLQLGLARVGHLLSAGFGIGAPLLFVPMAFSPVVLCVLLGQRMGIFAALYSSLLTALVVDSEDAYLFIILGLGCGLVGIAATRKVRRRSRLIQAGLYVGLTHWAMAWAFGVTTPLFVDFGQAEWKGFLIESLAILGVELGTVILLSGLLPVFEGLADVTTDVSWIEMSDLNHPLLKRLTIEAPGTYHHSLIVATLGEGAAESIGANATMVRVCSYFHDIGKLENPGLFIENQGGGPNPHDKLTPSMSALKIISHVKDGVALAKKEKLGRLIIDGIREHHGDSLVLYFHRKALELHEKQLEEVAKGLRTEEDLCQINEEDFRYPGPRPASKETAILSLADAVESASRTLRDHAQTTIQGMVDRIFEGRLRDGQLSDAPLTMRELSAIRQSFVATLGSVLHSRVPYPIEKEDAEVRQTTPTNAAP